MGKPSRPRKGSMGFSPRKRSLSQTPRFSSWPKVEEGPKLMGFAGYKAGMTHCLIVDQKAKTTTSGKEVQTPVTILEVPPMKVVGVRYYTTTPYGLKAASEDWVQVKDKHTIKRIPKHGVAKAKIDTVNVDEVRVIAHTQPHLVKGIPKKVPEIMEISVGGNDMKAMIEYAKGLLGKNITMNDFADAGSWVDVAAITKGKGFQGHVKRWGVKLLSHKNSKHRRMIGNLGPKSQGGGRVAAYVENTVPQAGQMGYHQRTEYNKLILKIGDKGEEIVPKGGFLHYGEVVNPYVIIKGSIPGPAKRLIKFRHPTRPQEGHVDKIDIKYVSLESKQGA